MAQKKIIAVVGATGAQGGGLARSILADFNDEFCRARSIETSRALNPHLQSFAQWLAAHAHEIPPG